MMEEFLALPASEQLATIRERIVDRSLSRRRGKEERDIACHLVHLVRPTNNEHRTSRAAMRLLLDIALARQNVVDDLVAAGILSSLCVVLTHQHTKLNTLAYAMHVLCRLVKDSQPAVNAMNDAESEVPAALAAATLRIMNPSTVTAPEEEEADDEEDEEPDDPWEQAADVYDELWTRMGDAQPDVLKHWATASLPALLALSQHESAGLQAMDALVNLLQAVEDDEELAARLLVPSLPGLASTLTRALHRESPSDFCGQGCPLVAARLAAISPPAGCAALIAAGVTDALPKWLDVDVARPEVLAGGSQLVFSLLRQPGGATILMAPGVLQGILNVAECPYKDNDKHEDGVERRRCNLGEGWYWDSHMAIIAGLASALEQGSGDTAALATVVVEAGGVATLVRVIAMAQRPAGCMGRNHVLLLRHALASLDVLLSVASEAARAAALAASAPAILEAAAARPELQPGDTTIENDAFLKPPFRSDSLLPYSKVPHDPATVRGLIATTSAKLAAC